MTRRLIALCALLVVAGGTLSAPLMASADDRGYDEAQVAPGPPPPPPYEAPQAGPGSSYVWVPGHWRYAGGWVWVPGHWAVAPYPGAVWVPGHWVHRRFGWVWVEGHWQGGGPGYVVVTSPPPPPRAEIIGVAPFVGAVWIGGFWRWTGATWVWVGGHWARRPWPRAVWVPGHWARQAGGWIWIEGYWR